MAEDDKVGNKLRIKDTSNIQLEDIRAFMLDNLTTTNVLGTDYYFSDEEIEEAIRRMIMSYNGIPPYNFTMTYGNLRLNDIVLYGVAYQLCITKLMALQRKDVTYNSGGSSIQTVAAQIRHLTQMMQLFKQEFETRVLQQKRSANMLNAFGHYL